MDYTLHHQNGLDIIIAPLADANSTTIEVMVKAGSIYETKSTNGLSHFLEHMFFKGGKKYQTPHSVALALDAIGADYNAYTSDEYAGYYIKCAPLFFNTAVDVLSDMLCETAFPEPELEREKGVITQEVMMYQDDPSSLVRDKWARACFGDNAYGWTTLGPVENIQGFVRQDFVDHKKNLYTKDNLVIVVAGKIGDEKSVLSQVVDAFDSLPESGSASVPTFEGMITGSDHYTKKTEQNHIIISLPSVDGSHTDRYGLSVLSTVLGGNMSSRLFQRVREQEGLCYSIGAGHGTSPQCGTIYLKAGMDKERFGHAKERMMEELLLLSRDGITQKEFDATINYVRGQLQMGIESSSSLASFLGKQHLLYGRIDTLETKLKAFESLTLDGVNTLTGYFDPSKSFSYWIE